MKKQIIALALALLMLLTLFTACATDSGDGANKPDDGSSTSNNNTNDDGDAANDSDATGEKNIEDIKIGISIATTTQERWNREIEMFEDYAETHGFEVLIQSAEDDVQKQASQIENLINQDIDVLILQGLDADASAPSVDLCHEAGIKVIAYDRIVNNPKVDYYLSFDSVLVGEEIAKLTLEAAFAATTEEKINVMLLEGGPEDNNAHLINKGHMNILQPYIDDGSITVVAEQWCANWDPNEALNHVENALVANNNDIQAIIAPNDGCAGGAIQALAVENLAGAIPIAGQDGELAACQRIVEGSQTGTVYKPIARLNQAAMELAVAVATGTADPVSAVDPSLGEWGSYEDYITECFYIAVDVITADNLYDIIIERDAFHALEDVYKNVSKDEWPA